MSNQSYSSKTSTKVSRKSVVHAGQADIFGGINDVKQLINPEPQVIERHGVKVVGVVIPQDKMIIPGYVPEALRQARALVPEVQTSGKPPWLSAKWQTQRRKKRATM